MEYKELYVVKKGKEEKGIEIDEDRLMKVESESGETSNITVNNKPLYMAHSRGRDVLDGKAIYLDDDNYDYVLGKNRSGDVLLVPLKKEGK